MAGKLKILSHDLKALGSTSKAFEISKKEELMREYTLSFSIVNIDSIFQHISETSVFEYNGQYFDITGINGTSGNNNTTKIVAEHVSYRLSEYTLPDGYAFVGTIKEIAEDILREAKTLDEVSASTVFNIGTCCDKETFSYAISGTNVTARAALIGLNIFGVEIEFDNFELNIPEMRGADNDMVFEYNHNLEGCNRTWQKGNGWSYEYNIADLQKIPGHIGDNFAIGDYVTVRDKTLKTTTKNRIISYTECDIPSQNKIVIGVFVRDNADIAIETGEIAREAYSNSENALQEGKKYSNVSVTHTDGFKAVNRSNSLRVMMNGDDCFVVQGKNSNGEWETITSAEFWGLLAPRLTTQNAKNIYYVTVGKDENDNIYGAHFYYVDGYNFKKHCAIKPVQYTNEDGTTFNSSTQFKSEGALILSGKEVRFKDDKNIDIGITTTINYMARENVASTLKFKNGLLVE